MSGCSPWCRLSFIIIRSSRSFATSFTSSRPQDMFYRSILTKTLPGQRGPDLIGLSLIYFNSNFILVCFLFRSLYSFFFPCLFPSKKILIPIDIEPPPLPSSAVVLAIYITLPPYSFSSPAIFCYLDFHLILSCVRIYPFCSCSCLCSELFLFFYLFFSLPLTPYLLFLVSRSSQHFVQPDLNYWSLDGDITGLTCVVEQKTIYSLGHRLNSLLESSLFGDIK